MEEEEGGERERERERESMVLLNDRLLYLQVLSSNNYDTKIGEACKSNLKTNNSSCLDASSQSEDD